MKTKLSLKDLLNAFNIVKAASPADLEALKKDEKLKELLEGVKDELADLNPEFSKAASNLTPAEFVMDMWQAMGLNAPATKEEIKTGPSQASSGGGAAHMVKEYSEFTPQHGITLVAESLNRIMGPIADSMKALIDASKAQTDILNKLVTQKAEEEDEGEESEVAEVNAAKAKGFTAKAKTFLEKAADCLDEARISKGDEKKKLREEAKSLKKQAGKLLGKAQQHAAGAGKISADLLKSISDVAAKSDVEVVQEEEDDDEEEEDSEKAKGDDAATKAGAKDDAGSDSMQTPEQQAHAKGMTEIRDALNGLGMLSTDVRGLLDTIAGKSRVGAGVPDFAKGGAKEDQTDMADRINLLESSGQLGEADAMAARDIFSKARAAKAGKIDTQIVVDCIAKSSSAVRALFADMSKAA